MTAASPLTPMAVAQNGSKSAYKATRNEWSMERERETGEFNPLSLPRSQTLDCGPFGRRSDVASADSARSRFFLFKQFWKISPILVKSSRFALSRDIVEEFL